MNVLSPSCTTVYTMYSPANSAFWSQLIPHIWDQLTSECHSHGHSSRAETKRYTRGAWDKVTKQQDDRYLFKRWLIVLHHFHKIIFRRFEHWMKASDPSLEKIRQSNLDVTGCSSLLFEWQKWNIVQLIWENLSFPVRFLSCGQTGVGRRPLLSDVKWIGGTGWAFFSRTVMECGQVR